MTNSEGDRRRLLAAGRGALEALAGKARCEGPASFSPSGRAAFEGRLSDALSFLSACLDDPGEAPNKAYARIAECTASVVLLCEAEPDQFRRMFDHVAVSADEGGATLREVVRLESFLHALFDDHDYALRPGKDGLPAVTVAPSGLLARICDVEQAVQIRFGGPQGLALAIETNLPQERSAPRPMGSSTL